MDISAVVRGGAGMWVGVRKISTLNFQVSKGGEVGYFPLMRVLLLLCALFVNSWADPVQVTITGIRNDKGQVAALVYKTEKGFPDQRGDAYKVVALAAKKGSVTLTMKGLEPGKYAIAVIHDENSDGAMETNFIGLPKEGVGVTGGMGFSKPKFRKSVINVAAGQNISIYLKYF